MPRTVQVAALWSAALLTDPMFTDLTQSWAGEPAADAAANVFGMTRIWKIHLRVSAENWRAIQP